MAISERSTNGSPFATLVCLCCAGGRFWEHRYQRPSHAGRCRGRYPFCSGDVRDGRVLACGAGVRPWYKRRSQRYLRHCELGGACRAGVGPPRASHGTTSRASRLRRQWAPSLASTAPGCLSQAPQLSSGRGRACRLCPWQESDFKARGPRGRSRTPSV